MAHGHRIFPWWAGYLLAHPIRKLVQNPEQIVGPYVKPGMTVLEIGPGMGFFSIPMARLVGENGRVVAVDIQEKMLRALERRATKSGVRERIGTRLCDTGSFGISDLAGQVDFALLFAVVHEVPDPERLWREVAGTLKKGALVLFSEPKRPVSEEEFRKSVDQSELSGLRIVRYPRIWKSRSVLLQMI